MLRGEMSHFFSFFLLKQILFTCIHCVYVSNKKEGTSTQQTKDKDGLVYTLVDFFKFCRGIIYTKMISLFRIFHTNTMAHRIIKQEIKMGLFVSMSFFLGGGWFFLNTKLGFFLGFFDKTRTHRLSKQKIKMGLSASAHLC